MRIISKYHDYYDCIQNIGGFDDTIIYEREDKNNEIKLDKFDIDSYLDGINCFLSNNINLFNPKYPINSYVYIETFLIGFCGEMYKSLMIQFNEDKYFAYSYKDLKDIIKKLNIKELNEYFGKQKDISNFGKKRRWSWSPITRKNMKTFFNKNTMDKYKYIFQEYKTPIFVIHDNNKNRNLILEINSILKDYDFYKVKHAYEAFQDIEWYISGVLRLNEKEIIDIKDEDMLYKKGFNEKSFKKEPTKKK